MSRDSSESPWFDPRSRHVAVDYQWRVLAKMTAGVHKLIGQGGTHGEGGGCRGGEGRYRAGTGTGKGTGTGAGTVTGTVQGQPQSAARLPAPGLRNFGGFSDLQNGAE